jgi:undecaprenyl-diphosphatase
MSRAHLGLFVIGLVVFVALALAYEHEPVATVDEEVSEWVGSDLPGWVEAIARPPSWLGGWIGVTIIGIVLGVVLVRERAWLDLGFLLATFAGAQLTVALLKDWVDRARPDAGSAVELPSSAAFPSGHAAAGAASLGAAAVLIAERLPSRRARTWLWGVVVVGGIAVGLSRIALNVHFVTDVLAGWCFGIAWLAACLMLRERFRRPG